MKDEKNTPQNENDKLLTKKKITIYVLVALACLAVIAFVVLITNVDVLTGKLSWIFTPFTPIFFGALIAYLCNPLYVIFQNKVFAKMRSVKWRKTLAILLTYIVVFVVIVGLLVLVAQQMIVSVQSFIDHIPEYIANAEQFIVDFIDGLGFIKSESEIGGSTTSPPIADTTTSNDVTIAPDITTPRDENNSGILDFSFTKEGILESIHNFFENSGDLLNSAGQAIVNTIVSSGTVAVNFVFNLFLGIIFSIYMLTEKDLIIAKAKKAVYAIFKKERADSICELGRYADDKVGHFITGKLIESVIVGAMSFVAFLIFRIPSPIMIAVIVAIMNIIPIFGPFLGAIPAAFIVLIMDPPKAIPYIIIVLIIMQINGNYISPKIVGNRTGLTPLAAIAALTLMSGYFGIIGMFLGIPICAIVVEMLWRKANESLKKKELATDVAAYYAKDALIEEEKPKKPKNFTSVVVDTTVNIFCKIFKVNKNKDKKKDNNIDGTTDDKKK